MPVAIFLFFYSIVVAIQASMFSYAIVHLSPVFVGALIVVPFWKCIVLAVFPVIGQFAFPAFLLALLIGI